MRYVKHWLLSGWLPFGFLVPICAATSWAQDTSESPAMEAAKAFVGKVRSGALCPPNWDGANVTGVEVVQTQAARWHVCKLTGAGEPRGYVLLAEVDGELTPVMYSGSAVPLQLIELLQPPANGGPAEPPSQMQGAADVIMIGTFSGETKGESVSTGAAASALATVLGHLQEREGYPLLYYTALGRRDFRDAMSGSLSFPKERSPSPASAPVAPRPADSQKHTFREFREQEEGVLEGAGLLEQTGDSEHRSRRVTKPVSAFRTLSPLFRQHLASPAGVSDRVALINAERIAAESAAGEERSRGCINAFLLEVAYLADSPTIETAVKTFFLSRGFSVSCDRQPIAEVTPNELPCVVVGPTSPVAATLIARSPLSDTGWAQICVHETVTTTRETLWERRQRRAIAAGAPSGDFGMDPADIDPSLPPERQEAMRRAIERDKAYEQKRVIVEDPVANPPTSLTEGAHMIVLGALSDWQAVGISSPEIAPNWGDSVPTLRRRR